MRKFKEFHETLICKICYISRQQNNRKFSQKSKTLLVATLVLALVKSNRRGVMHRKCLLNHEGIYLLYTVSVILSLWLCRHLEFHSSFLDGKIKLPSWISFIFLSGNIKPSFWISFVFLSKIKPPSWITFIFLGW